MKRIAIVEDEPAIRENYADSSASKVMRYHLMPIDKMRKMALSNACPIWRSLILALLMKSMVGFTSANLYVQCQPPFPLFS